MEMEMIAVGFRIRLSRMNVLQYTACQIKGHEAEGSGQP